MSFDAASQNIFYACAAYVKQSPYSVLGEYGTGPTQGAVSKVVKNMIQKLSNAPNQSLRTSYAQGDLLYHVKQGNGKVFICVSGKQMPLRIAFNFLEDVESRPNPSSQVLRERMEYHSSNDKIAQIREKVDIVKDQMVQNIDKILERGEQLDNIVIATDDLNQSAYQFQRKSKSLKNKVIIGAVLLTIILISILLFILLVIIIIIVIIVCTNVQGRCQSQQQ